MNNRTILGNLGEELFVRKFGGVRSENKYDSEKDIVLLDGKYVEVKTQCRHNKLNAFTVSKKQETNFQKCLIVDHLVFIEYGQSDIISVWHCVDRNSYFFFTTNSGKEMIGWPIDKMKKVATIDDKKLAAQMRSLSQSKYINQ